MIDDALVDSIVELGNDPDFIKQLEPNLMWHMQLESWMVRRVLAVMELNKQSCAKSTGR